MIGSFDLTTRCPLRCAHCYFFADERAVELDDEVYLERLASLRETYGLRSAFWVGGEPLLRAGLLTRAMRLFPRNAVATSGMVPIPALDAGLLVSLDGLESTHDLLRGSGSFARVSGNLRALSARSFALSTTISARTTHVIDELERLVAQTRAAGVLVGFVTGPADDPLVPNATVREAAIDALQVLRERAPGLLLNSSAGLERMRPSAQAADTSCIYQGRALAFDAALELKSPCTFGVRADCSACGCPVVAEQRARATGNRESDGVLRALFPASIVQEGATYAPSR